MPGLAKRSSLWTPVFSLEEVGDCNGLGGRWVVGDGEMLVRMDKRWNFVACPIAVDPSRKLRSFVLALGSDLLILSWVASVWWVMMRGILIMGSPLSGLADLQIALWRNCCKVGCSSRCGEDVVCAVEDSIDDGQLTMEACT